jgi:small subunit ribosomal protein S9
MAESKYSYSLGRRKTSVATLRLFESSGKNIINDKPLEQLYVGEFEKVKLLRPFKAAELESKDFNFTVKVKGGGHNSQLEAIVLALSRAIIKKYPERKKLLKNEGLLTRDSRMVERKKPGLRKARKAEQYSKR